jgi:hypothetical protein
MVMAEFKFQLTNQNVKFPLYQYYGIYTEVFSVNTMFWMWTKYQTKRRENYCSSQLDVHMFLDLYMYHLYSLTLFFSTTGATSGAGTAFPSGIPEFTTVFFGVCVTQSLVLCACFVDRCLSFCTFSFGHCVVCSSSMYGFWLSLWYLSTHFLKLCYNYVYNKSLTIPKR